MLRLFITGVSPNSTKAVTNVKGYCEEFIKGRYTLEIIDVYQQPAIAEEEQIIALPLLIRKSPLPVKKFIGDMSNRAKVLKGLGFTEIVEQ